MCIKMHYLHPRGDCVLSGRVPSAALDSDSALCRQHGTDEQREGSRGSGAIRRALPSATDCWGALQVVMV